jgi:hypothetical protein
MKKTLLAALAWFFAVGVALILPLSSVQAMTTHALETELRQYTEGTAVGVDGFILFNGTSDPRTYSAAPNGVAYLINRAGYKVKEWSGVSFGPRLLENGKLWSVGQIRAWDGTLEWQYTAPAGYNIHHEGMRIWNKKLNQYTYLMLFNYTASSAELIAAGVGSATAGVAQLDGIMEVNQSKEIVWEWRFLDHGCQSQNAAWANYNSDVSTLPGKLNLFYKTNEQIRNGGGPGVANDWTHATSIDYNETLDQIVINSRNLSEIYIIDHGNTFTSTTTWATNIAAAKGSGGDFLYRFGNADAYGKMTVKPVFRAERQQQLFGPDQVTWVGNEWNTPHSGDSWSAPNPLPLRKRTTSDTDTTHLLVFNNGIYRPTGAASRIEEINPYFDSAFVNQSSYVSEPAAGWGLSGTYRKSNQITYTYVANHQAQLFDPGYSAVQRLSNSGLFISQGIHGTLYQIPSTGAAAVNWEYVVPDVGGQLLTVRTDDIDGANVTPVRARFYPTTFPGLPGGLTGTTTITGNPTRAIGSSNDPTLLPNFSCGSCSAACAPSTGCPTCETCVPCNGPGCCGTDCTPNTTCDTCVPCNTTACCGTECTPVTTCDTCVDCNGPGCCVGTDCTPDTSCADCVTCNTPACCDPDCTPNTTCDTCVDCNTQACCGTDCTPRTDCPTCPNCGAGDCCDGDTCIPQTDCPACPACNSCCPGCEECENCAQKQATCPACGAEQDCPKCAGTGSCCQLIGLGSACPSCEVQASPLQGILNGWGVSSCPACPCGPVVAKSAVNQAWGVPAATQGGGGGTGGGGGGGADGGGGGGGY